MLAVYGDSGQRTSDITSKESQLTYVVCESLPVEFSDRSRIATTARIRPVPVSLRGATVANNRPSLGLGCDVATRDSSTNGAMQSERLERPTLPPKSKGEISGLTFDERGVQVRPIGLRLEQRQGR